MGDYDDMIVINEGYEHRFTAGGKERVTVVVKAEPLVHNFDPKTLGRGPAKAIAFHLAERIREIATAAKPATLLYRKKAAKAFAEGKEWARKRYGGGRMGDRAPNQSDRAFNDSGRFAESITANGSSDGAWRVNVAANRLNGETGNFERIYQKLIALVPEFANPELLMSQDLIQAAIKKSANDIVTKLGASSRNVGLELAKQVIDLAEAAFGLLEPGLGDVG